MSRPVSAKSRAYRWNSLPYGLWTCDDGREVLFNRRYQAIWQRIHGECSVADKNEWVRFQDQEWFYDHGSVERHQKFNYNLRAILAAFQRGDNVRGRRA